MFEQNLNSLLSNDSSERHGTFKNRLKRSAWLSDVALLWLSGQTDDRQVGRQTDKRVAGQTGRQTNRWVGIHAGSQTEG